MIKCFIMYIDVFQIVMCSSFCTRLDVILGKVGSKRKDVYDSKQSLASRIVKVERSVMNDKMYYV